MKIVLYTFLILFSSQVYSGINSKVNSEIKSDMNSENNSDSTNQLANLEPLEWKNRIIIANAVENPQPLIEQFEKQTAGINERVIVWFIIQPKQVLTNFQGTLAEMFANNIQTTYQLKQGEVVLIGKDGGIKSSRQYLDLPATFGEIDAMPMRVQEMRRNAFP